MSDFKDKLDQIADAATATGRTQMKGEILRIIARRRLSATARVEAELADLIAEISKLS